MKPVAFEYHAPDSVPGALELLAGTSGQTMPLAGGYSLVPLLSRRLHRPAAVVDLNRVPDLAGIRVTDDRVQLGAMTRLCTLETSPALRDALPILPETAGYVAHQQIRWRSTLGGSLCHADPAAELPALAVALGARFQLRSADGARTVAAADFYRGAHGTARRPDELLTEVEFPRHRALRFRFEEVSRRGGAGLPLVAACVGLALDDEGTVTGARIAAAGVADRPLRLAAAEQALTGLRAGGPLTGTLDAAADAASPAEDVHGDAAYRRALLRAVIRRAVAHLTSERTPR